VFDQLPNPRVVGSVVCYKTVHSWSIRHILDNDRNPC